MVVILSESLYSTEKRNSFQFINNYLYELSRVNMDTIDKYILVENHG